MPSVIRFVTGIALLLGLVACPASPSGRVAAVVIVGGDQTLAQDLTLALVAEVEVTGTVETGVTWSSADPSVATVDASGVVSAIAPGATTVSATSVVDASKSDTITLTVEAPGTVRWTLQFGTTGQDQPLDVAVDASGNVFVAGLTTGAFEGVNAGGLDGFVRSYDAEGNERWTRQFGTAGNDIFFAVTTDALGNVYVAGSTTGDLDDTEFGGSYAFVVAYDGSGEHRWTERIGTVALDEAFGIVTDGARNIYVTGRTNGTLQGTNQGGADAFVRSYTSDGAHRWTDQFGTAADDFGTDIATAPDGTVYVSGHTLGPLQGTNRGGTDAFVRSYDADGAHRWTVQFGTTENDRAFGIATDATGNVFVAGATLGALDGEHVGDQDAFVRSYDGAGTLRWGEQFGTPESDSISSLAIGASGFVYVAGSTLGDLSGTNLGLTDAFVASLDIGGAVRWTDQFGTGGSDFTLGVAVDPTGTVFVAGYVFGELVAPQLGIVDGFVRSYGP